MVSLDDFELLARYRANELTASETTDLEARLTQSVELRAALLQFDAVEQLAAELPRVSLRPAQVEALVTRSTQW